MSYKETLQNNNQELEEILNTVNELPTGGGENGATFTPSVSEDGVISWENDKGLPNPDPVNIKGKDAIYILAEGETPADAPADVDVVIDPNGEGESPTGGVTSWNDLEDRPFGEFQGDTLNWDGTYNADELFRGVYAHISDAVPTASDVANGLVLKALIDGVTDETPFSGEEAMSFFQEDGFFNLEYLLMIVPYDGYVLDGVEVPKAGIYVIIELPNLTLTIPNYTGFIDVKKIDKKYLPDMGYAKTTVLYVGWKDGKRYLYKDYDNTVPLYINELYGLLSLNTLIYLYLANNERALASYVSSYGVVYIGSDVYLEGQPSINVAYVHQSEEPAQTYSLRQNTTLSNTMSKEEILARLNRLKDK